MGNLVLTEKGSQTFMNHKCEFRKPFQTKSNYFSAFLLFLRKLFDVTNMIIMLWSETEIIFLTGKSQRSSFENPQFIVDPMLLIYTCKNERKNELWSLSNTLSTLSHTLYIILILLYYILTPCINVYYVPVRQKTEDLLTIASETLALSVFLSFSFSIIIRRHSVLPLFLLSFTL